MDKGKRKEGMKQIMFFMFMPPPQIEVFVQAEREKKTCLLPRDSFSLSHSAIKENSPIPFICALLSAATSFFPPPHPFFSWDSSTNFFIRSKRNFNTVGTGEGGGEGKREGKKEYPFFYPLSKRDLFS